MATTINSETKETSPFLLVVVFFSTIFLVKSCKSQIHDPSVDRFLSARGRFYRCGVSVKKNQWTQ